VLVDPYRWLEDDASPAVHDWTAAQNAFTRGILDAYPGRRALEERLRSLYALPVMSTPGLQGSRFFYSRRAGSENQPKLMVQPADRSAAPRLVLDPNTLSADGTVALDWFFPTPDGALLAYGTSPNGSEMSSSTRRVDDGGSADQTAYAAHTSVAWDSDNQGFLYVRHPGKGEVPEGEEVFHAQIFHHMLGDDSAKDPLLWGGEGRAMQEARGVDLSSDGKWVFLETTLDWAKNDIYLKPAGRAGAFAPLAVGLDGHVHADAWGGKLYLRSNVDARAIDPGGRHNHGAESWRC
jgi:prolyl oligopeptidase